jgi:hypothetical protein
VQDARAYAMSQVVSQTRLNVSFELPAHFASPLYSLNNESLDLSLADDKTKSSNAKTKVVAHSRFRSAKPKWSCC